jgi:hypothetical protein
MKTAPALHSLHETGPKNEDGRTKKQPQANKKRYACGRAFEAGRAPAEKKGLGGRRKSLIRLDSAKKIKGNP